MIVDIPFNPVCPAGWATCSTYNGCVTCQTTHFLLLHWPGMTQTGSCVKACHSGYYGTRRHRHGKCLSQLLKHLYIIQTIRQSVSQPVNLSVSQSASQSAS